MATDRQRLVLKRTRLRLLGPERPDEDAATSVRRAQLKADIEVLESLVTEQERLPYGDD